MEAVVTLKVSPQELDVVRNALCVYYEERLVAGDDTDNPPDQRRNAKAQALQTKTLVDKLQ